MTSSSTDWYKRWRTREEFEGLTWGMAIDGTQFYEAFLKTGSKIDENDIVCEIGPGYGRIFDTFSENFSLKKCYMVEISPKRSEGLKRKYKNDPRVVVLCQNVDLLELPEKFDVGISTLTFKHLYPDCSTALSNVSRYMNKDGFFVFDIIVSDKDRILFEEANIINHFAEDTLKDFINLAGLFVEEEGVVDYPVGPRNIYRLGKRTLSTSILKKNELNSKRLSLQRQCCVLEDYSINLHNKVQRIRKNIPYRIMRKLRMIA
jgi:SAM-dependent methyltransferase